MQWSKSSIWVWFSIKTNLHRKQNQAIPREYLEIKFQKSKNQNFSKKHEQIPTKSNAKNSTKNLSKIKSKVNKFSIESESIILDRLQLICTTYCWVEVTEYWRIWPMPIQIIMRRVCRFTHILIIVYMHVCAYRRSSNASL